MNDNNVRAVRLKDGMIVSFYGMLLEWENGKFYGVIERQCSVIADRTSHKYIRTGLEFNADEINLLSKELKWWYRRY